MRARLSEASSQAALRVSRAAEVALGVVAVALLALSAACSSPSGTRAPDHRIDPSPTAHRTVVEQTTVRHPWSSWPAAVGALCGAAATAETDWPLFQVRVALSDALSDEWGEHLGPVPLSPDGPVVDDVLNGGAYGTALSSHVFVSQMPQRGAAVAFVQAVQTDAAGACSAFLDTAGSQDAGRWLVVEGRPLLLGEERAAVLLSDDLVVLVKVQGSSSRSAVVRLVEGLDIEDDRSGFAGGLPWPLEQLDPEGGVQALSAEAVNEHVRRSWRARRVAQVVASGPIEKVVVQAGRGLQPGEESVVWVVYVFEMPQVPALPAAHDLVCSIGGQTDEWAGLVVVMRQTGMGTSPVWTTGSTCASWSPSS
jgi:hypothetical protein